MYAEILSHKLNHFLDCANNAVYALEKSKQEESQISTDDDEIAAPLPGYSAESRRANLESSDKVSCLKRLAQEIEGIILEHPGLLENCSVQHLSLDFSGEGIRNKELAEDDASCCDRFFLGNASRGTLLEIQSTSAKVRNVEQEALAMYNYLNPDDQKSISCCRDCVIL